jgi:AmpD protein
MVRAGPQGAFPHHNERLSPEDVSLLVIHGISLPPGSLVAPLSTICFWGASIPVLTPISPVFIN